MKRHSSHRNKDLLISSLFKVPKVFFKNRDFLSSQKIAILKFSGIGDAILALPAIRALKKKTNANISVICSSETKIVFENQDFVDEIYSFDIKNGTPIKFFNFFLKMKKKQFNVSIDTSQSSIISAFVSRYISKYSIGFENWVAESRNRFFDKLIKISDKKHMIKSYYDLVKEFNVNIDLKLIEPAISKKIDIPFEGVNRIGIHATCPLKYKVWPKENFAKVIDYLLDRGNSILLFGGKEEREENQEIIKLLKSKNKMNIINLVGRASFPEMFYLLPQLKLFLANDGGPMHLASSFNIPVVGIFGAETPLRYAPYNKKSWALYKSFKNGPIIGSYKLVWPTEKNYEIPDKITVDEVKDIVKSVLK